MRFICDVHLPIRLSKFLVAQGAESVHVNQILDGSSTADVSICHYADENDCIVITKDADFKNSYLLRKTPRKLIRVCLGNLSNDELVELFTKHLPLIRQLNGEDSFYLEFSPNAILLF